MRALLGAVVRAAVVVLATLAWVEVAERGDSTDALGTGLIAFLLMVTISFAWALADGVRHGFFAALHRWLPGGVLGAAGITLLVSDDRSWDSAVFFAVLLLGPALVGAGIGGLLHRAGGGRREPTS